MIEPYITAPENAALCDDVYTSWVEVAPGVQMANRPLWDRTTGLWARLTYRGAVATTASLGCRLPTQSEVMRYTQIAIAHGVCLKPVTLSYGPEMIGLAHAVEHDRRVLQQLDAMTDERRADAVANIGKHWVAGAAPGRARICGWWDGRKFIQAGGADVHGDTHHDYATTTMVVRDKP